MTMNLRLCAFIVCTWLSGSLAFGQQPGYTPYSAPSPIPNGETVPQTTGITSGGGLSDWIQYNDGAAAFKRDCCEGRPGSHAPLYTELYVRVGPAVPVSGETLSRELKVGWTIVGGGRALFFNEALTKTWTVDAHIINTNQSGGDQRTRFPVTILVSGADVNFGSGTVPGVTIKASNRTMAGLGGGREWYLFSCANSDSLMWRCGVDGGGRWGSQRLDLHETHHLTDSIEGIYAAVHTDVDLPTHFGIFSAGFRIEWAHTWTHILRRPSNVEDLNALFTLGLRF